MWITPFSLDPLRSISDPVLSEAFHLFTFTRVYRWLQDGLHLLSVAASATLHQPTQSHVSLRHSRLITGKQAVLGCIMFTLRAPVPWQRRGRGQTIACSPSCHLCAPLAGLLSLGGWADRRQCQRRLTACLPEELLVTNTWPGVPFLLPVKYVTLDSNMT